MKQMIDQHQYRRKMSVGEPQALLAGSLEWLPLGLVSNDNRLSVHLGPVCDLNISADFQAVILRHQMEFAQGHFEIILARADHEPALVVARYEDDGDVIAEWRFIGARLNLPLFLMNESGTLERYEPTHANPTRTRRLGSPLSGRRPRFLRRRKEGAPCLMALVYSAHQS